MLDGEAGAHRPIALRTVPRPAFTRCARPLVALVAALFCALAGGRAAAQLTTSYVDDSILARESLSRLEELLAAGNLNEAARIVQAVLDTESERVIESAREPVIYISVRDAVHEALHAHPDLLERYRQREEPIAETMLREGQAEDVERTRLMTRSGFDAALRIATDHFESARFEAARLTLEQLDRHPDRADAAAGSTAADLAAMLAAYLPREPVTGMARRWAQALGRPDPTIVAVSWPDRWSQSFGRDSTQPASAAELDSLVAGPLQSVFLSGDAGAEFRVHQELPRDDQLTSQLVSWTFPTVVGDDVLVNDGRAMTAFDRFTLAQRWRLDFSDYPYDPASTDPPDIRLVANVGNINDASTIAAGEGVAVAATGLQSNDLREGDNRLHAVEVSSGNELWALAPSGISETLRLAEFRGPCLIDQSTVVQAFRKESAARRLRSTYLAGIDLWTGRTRWVRLICSAGSMGSVGSRPGEITVAHQGIVYRVDDSGVVSAIEAASGRLRWMRIFRGDWSMRVGDASPPWAAHAPIIDGDSLVVLNPVQPGIHRLGLADGVEAAQRDMSGIPGPVYYLLAAGEGSDRSLVTVTDNRLAVLPLATFHTSPARLVPAVTDPGYCGRAVALGNFVAAPVQGGLLMASLKDPAKPQIRPLENFGNFVTSGSNLLVADTWRLHSYLAWEDADRLLSERIAADPKDPRPALALAELAYRAQRIDRLLPAIDQALAAMAAAPLSPATQQARPRLFHSILEMVEASTHTRPKANLPAKPLRMADLTLLDKLVSRMDRIAETPAEHISYLINLAALRELQSRGADACRAYQRILEDPQLADTMWREVSPPVPARQLAVDKLRAVIGTFGTAAYDPFAAELDAELAALPPAATPEALEALADRYPVAVRAPEVLLKASRLHRAANNPRGALADLARASETSWWLVSVGLSDQQVKLGEILGAHVQALAEIGRPMTAAQVLLKAVKSRPGLIIFSGGEPLNPTARAAALIEEARRSARPANIGSEPGRELAVLPGWMLLSPLLEHSVTPQSSHEWVAMVEYAGKRFAAFADLGDGVLRPVWTRPYQDRAPKVLESRPDRLIVLWDDDTSIERMDPATGETVWRTPPIARMLPPAAASGVRILDTPLDGQVRSIDLVPALSDTHIAIVQRDGAAVVLDAASGRVAWSSRTPLTRVYDVSLVASAIVVSGAADPSDNADPEILDRREPRVPPRPLMVALSIATGQPLYDPISPATDIRWTRSDGRMLVVSLADRLRAIDPATGNQLWEDVAGEEMAQVPEGWVFGDAAYVLSRRRELVRIDLATGQKAPLNLEAADRLSDAGRITAGRVGQNIAFSSRHGVCLLDKAGQVVGANSLGGRRDFLPAIAAGKIIALIEQSTDELPDGRSALRVMLVTADSAKLLRTLAVIVEGEPDTITAALLDNKLVLSTDLVTQVISLPAGPRD
ncbi:MAG: Outer membrane protein assembly factor BamB [Phycisphaerales bacterium]|nr:Outer membrane protein assembly factor BamB [Phycisphaerales bacterium]